MATSDTTTGTTTTGRGHVKGEAASKQAILAGLVSGLIAGTVMILVHMLYMELATPMEFGLPLKNIAATWYGPRALLGGADVIFVGLLTHLVVAAAWGVLFGLLVGRFTSMRLVIMLGLLYGVIVWVMMTFAVMPAADPTMAERVATIEDWWWLVVHLVFGATLVLTRPLARAFSGGSSRRRPAPVEQPVAEPA